MRKVAYGIRAHCQSRRCVPSTSAAAHSEHDVRVPWYGFGMDAKVTARVSVNVRALRCADAICGGICASSA
jgi:hypothetical protein